MENIKRSYIEKSFNSDDIAKLAQDLGSDSAKQTLLFVSNQVDTKKLTPYLKKYFNKNLTAVTTSGEICNNGYNENSISGVSFHGEKIQTEYYTIHNLEKIDSEIEDILAVIKTTKENEKILGEGAKSFAILLIDGLSIQEENITGLIGNALGDIPLIGGSAGDGLDFKHTYIYSEEKFQEGIAKLILFTTSIPFETFKIQHFEETEKKLVITDSRPETRTVLEIDGEPAAQAYANLLGMNISEFSPQVFSEYPLMLKIGSEYFVRSIQKVNPDNSLTFFCAIDDGLVLTLAKRKDLFQHTKDFLCNAKDNLNNISCSLLFECILRRLEVLNKSSEEQKLINDLYHEYSSVGFHTYGEQYGPIHINQTLTGVIFGKEK